MRRETVYPSWLTQNLSPFQQGSYTLRSIQKGLEKRKKRKGRKDHENLAELRAETQCGSDSQHWTSVSVSQDPHEITTGMGLGVWETIGIFTYKNSHAFVFSLRKITLSISNVKLIQWIQIQKSNCTRKRKGACVNFLMECLVSLVVNG